MAQGREVGLGGAVILGLGSIVGTGVYVSLGLAVDLVGSAVAWALLLAASVALFNGLSSAQLAASHPVSGGTYEYGYRYLNHWALVRRRMAVPDRQVGLCCHRRPRLRRIFRLRTDRNPR